MEIGLTSGGPDLLRIRQQVHAEAGARGDVDEAVVRQRHLVDDVAAQVLRARLEDAGLEAGRVFLDREVGDGRVQLQARRQADRRERVVRHHLHVVGLGDGRHLLGAGDAAAQAQVHPRVLDAAARQQGLELVDVGEALAGGDRDADLLGHPRHAVRAFGTDRVLDEHRVGVLDAAREHDRLGRGQAAVDLDQQVDAVAHHLAHAPGVVDGVAHLLDVGLEVDLVVALVQEGIQVAEGVEAGFHLGLAFHQHLVDAVLVDVAVDARLGARRPAQQLVDRHVERLALDVPQGDVDRRDGGVLGQAGEVAEAVHHVPVMLDGEGVLALQVLGEAADAGAGGLDVAPGARLAVADDALVGGDADEHELPHVQGLDFADLHCLLSGTVAQSTLMRALWIRSLQRRASASTWRAASAGVMATGSAPAATSFSRTSGFFSTFCTSPCR
jgi:hypothetical protein